MTPKYYGYSMGGFVMAVDATSLHDARTYADIMFPGDKKYLGYMGAGSFPKTACGVITTKRQELIRDHNARWMDER